MCGSGWVAQRRLPNCSQSFKTEWQSFERQLRPRLGVHDPRQKACSSAGSSWQTMQPMHGRRLFSTNPLLCSSHGASQDGNIVGDTDLATWGATAVELPPMPDGYLHVMFAQHSSGTLSGSMEVCRAGWPEHAEGSATDWVQSLTDRFAAAQTEECAGRGVVQSADGHTQQACCLLTFQDHELCRAHACGSKLFGS